MYKTNPKSEEKTSKKRNGAKGLVASLTAIPILFLSGGVAKAQESTGNLLENLSKYNIFATYDSNANFKGIVFDEKEDAYTFNPTKGDWTSNFEDEYLRALINTLKDNGAKQRPITLDKQDAGYSLVLPNYNITIEEREDDIGKYYGIVLTPKRKESEKGGVSENTLENFLKKIDGGGFGGGAEGGSGGNSGGGSSGGAGGGSSGGGGHGGGNDAR